MIWYYSYGSNMNLQRMKDRKVKIYQVIPAKLENYELRFNKVSKKQGAVANVIYKKSSIVEGALFQVDSLTQMDKFEGYPTHYDRVMINIEGVDAWVYVAQPQHIQEGLKPKQEYLNHLLAGKQFLSDEYFQKLKMINE